MKKLLIALWVLPLLAFANTEIHLDHAPDRTGNQAALQNGAKIFVSYCLNCHAASFMRYSRLRDIGFTEQQIKDELMPAGGKIGDSMKVSMPRPDAARWFSLQPPDLSLVARARTSAQGSGEDWLYTYLRSFYRDTSRPSGWNNAIFDNVAMHHVLWEFQGEQTMGTDKKLTLTKPGTLTPDQYDSMVADLVGYLKYMSEPVAEKRQRMGTYVLIALLVLLGFAVALRSKMPRRPA